MNPRTATARAAVLLVLLAVVAVQPVGAAFAAAGPAQQRAGGLSDPAELETFVDGVMADAMETHHVAGGTVSVVKDGELFFAKGYGYADVANETPVVADETLFRVGSTSKLVTWTAVMQHVEAGTVDLDTDVNEYLSEVTIPDAYDDPVTLNHLGTHRAGFEERGIGLYAPSPDGIDPLGEELSENQPARVFPPGELSAYSNFGAALAGQVVAEQAGMPFDEYAERNVFAPLGMTSTTFRQPGPPALAANVSHGYDYVDGALEPQAYEVVSWPPAGSMSATATDMGAFMIAHLNDGAYGDARILDAATAREMHADRYTPHPAQNGWAYGFYEADRNGQRVIGHGGSTAWFHSQLVLLPDHDVGLFFSFNSAGGHEARDEVTEAFLDRYFPGEVPSTPGDVDGQADRVAGTYRSTRMAYTTFEKVGMLGRDLTVSAVDDDTIETVDASGETRRWEAIEPMVFREVGGQDVLAFEAVDGQLRLYPAAPVSANLRLAWYDTTDFHLALLGGIGVAFLTVLAWPALALWHRYRGGTGDGRAGARRARLLGGVAVLAAAGFLVALLAMLSGAQNLAFGMTTTVRVLLVVPFLVGVLAAGTVGAAGLAWQRGYWGLAGRLHYTLVALALVAFLWVTWYWRLVAVP
ncbi:serine hydrolase [Halobacteriaceae archaeon GCM10025711]